MRKLISAALVSLAIASGSLGAAAQEGPGPGPRPGPRPRVAVMNFEFGTVHHWWSGDWDVGKGIADLVVTDLVRGGAYSVIERKMIDDVMREQNFNNSNRADPSTASQIGKMLGVNAIIVGSVTQFGFEDKNFGIGGFGVGRGGFGLGNLGIGSQKAIVVVDARLINTTTGEIIAVASERGESGRSSFSGFGAGGRGGGGIDMGSSNFQNTIVGEATRKCVAALVADINQDAPMIASAGPQAMPLSGRVADYDGRTMTLNVGREKGLQAGDVLIVERVVRDIKDPDTGKVLRQVTNPVGQVTITQADEGSSVGTFAGTAAPKVGDRVHR